MPEISRTDKLAISAGFSVTLTPPPELAVTSVQAPAQNFSGQPMNLSWTVANIGTGPTVATPGPTRFTCPRTRSRLQRHSAGHVHSSGSAGGRGQLHRLGNGHLPVGVSGSFYFLVQTDVDGQVFQNGATGDERGRHNRRRDRQPDAAARPGSERDHDVPATALAGHGLTFSYTTTNAGAGATPNYYLERRLLPVADAHLQPGHGDCAGTGDTRGQPGRRRPAIPTRSRRRFPTASTGAYYLLVDTDSGNAVFELDKTNNWGASTGTDPGLIGACRPDRLVGERAVVGTARFGDPGQLDGGQPGRWRHGRQLLAGRRLHRCG